MATRAVMREKIAKNPLPIIVDPEGVIILGHERYYALKKMKRKIDFDVYDVPERIALKYRLVDCRISNQNPNVRLKMFHRELTTNYKKYEPKPVKKSTPKRKPKNKPRD